jgi:hypothetical protein
MDRVSWGKPFLQEEGHPPKVIIFISFLVLGGIPFLPALTAYFYTDDFVLLCISRYAGNPLLFFIQDHFPGSFFYRPFGMSFWWLSYQLFGLNPTLHNLLNLFLHILNTFIFYLMLLELSGRRNWVNYLVSLLFLCHPISVSTTLWLSDRFDLLATLFILLATYFFLRFLSGRHRKYFICSLFSAFLGMLSKETAYILPLILTSVCLSSRRSDLKGGGSNKVILLVPYCLLGIFLYLLRFLLLRGTETYFYQNGILQTFWKGLFNWIHFMVESFSYHYSFLESGYLLKYGFIGWFFSFLIILLLLIKRQLSIPWRVFLLGITMLWMPVFLSTPVMSLSTFLRPGQEFSFFLLAQGRFYYLSFIGFLFILDSSFFLPFPLFKRHGTPRLYSAFIMGILISISLFYLFSSFSLSRKYNDFTETHVRPFVELVGKAVSPSVGKGFKIYLLNTSTSPHGFREFGDAMLKATAPEHSQLMHCLIFTEKPPWYNFVLKEDIPEMRISPLQNMVFRKREFPPLRVGGVSYYYLIFPDAERIVKDERALFFEYLPVEKRFHDVTEKVKSGMMKPKFFNDRPEA